MQDVSGNNLRGGRDINLETRFLTELMIFADDNYGFILLLSLLIMMYSYIFSLCSYEKTNVETGIHVFLTCRHKGGSADPKNEKCVFCVAHPPINPRDDL